jgi:hypothetical protein
MIYAPVQSTRVHNLFVSALLWIATAFGATQPGFAESTESGNYTTDCYTDNCCCPFDGCAAARPQDEIWLISTRCLGCPMCDSPDLDAYRYTGNCEWESADLQACFANANPAASTVVWAHGNQIDAWGAQQRGLGVYRQLVTVADPRPMRFVIWSWPSEKIKGPLNDIRTKAWRTDTDGYYLGWFLQRMHPQSDVGLIGFSYGARIVSGALHVLAGGELDGWALQTPAGADRRPPRVALFAAAVHDYWLSPGAYHGLALQQVDRLILFNNSCDPVLSRYRFVSRGENPDAMGHSGVTWYSDPGEIADRVEQWDAACIVGKEHTLEPYICSPEIMGQVNDALLGSH